MLVLAAAAAGGCRSQGAPADTPAAPTAPPAAESTTTTVPPLAPPARYRPLPGEPAPEAKQAAADVVQALATFPADAEPVGPARARLAALGVAPAVADGAGALLAPGVEAAGDIVYPQLGGLTPTAASVMVVVTQRRREAGRDSSVARTVDVRLQRSPEGPWAVVALASTGGDPPAAPVPPSEAAAAVLAHPNLELPDSARWDVQAGRVDPRLLELIAALAADRRLAVTVLATGHPRDVFATGRVSNHTVGRAVDVWAVDGQAVVAQRQPDGPVAALARAALAAGVTELGGPWDLDGPGGRSFANTVHQDHLHLAFDA